jgi:cleavage and polyadenylation specificity factor subunit 1
MTDASADHVGASLQQRAGQGRPWEPLGFFSKKLDPAQTRYSAYDRELLACVSGIRHFRFMLEGRRFTLYTDHKPLTFALTKAVEPWTARQCRHLSYISEFTNDIRHVAGIDNVVADTMSRPPQAAEIVAAVAATPQSLDYAAIAEAQRSCPSIETARDTSLSLQLIPFGPVRVLCDTKGKHPRPVIPLGYRRQVFDAFHQQAHPGAKATRRLMRDRVVWTRMHKDINEWVADCQECARSKVTKQPAAAVQPIPVPQQRFSHIHVDIVGPLPVSRDGYRYLFTIIDRSSRLLEAVPLTNVETATCRDALIRHWICRFGVPAHLTSDQGAQFTSALWSRTCEVIGTHHNTTTAYHPQSNGMIERAHRRLKEALKTRLAAADWPDHLPWVLLALNVAPKEDSGKSAAEMVFGASLTLPAQLAASQELPVEDILHALRSADPIPTRHGQKEAPTEPPSQLVDAEMVYVRKGGQLPPLEQPYSGPYKVVEKGPKFFRLDIGGKQTAVSVDRLKPHTGTAAATPAAPPRRGRPPAARAQPTPAPAPSPRSPSPGLPATAGARPARLRKPPSRLVL